MRVGRRLVRRVVVHLGLVCFGIALGLLLLEGGLRIAGFAARRYYALEPPQSPSGRVRILSLGDSNTFGLYVGRIRAYPHLLERRWNARSDRRPIEVINAGYPGNTSWSVRGRLGDLLAAYRPEIVTVMIGSNDAWRDAESPEIASVEACAERARAVVTAPAVPQAEEWRLVRALKLLEPWLPQPLEHFPFGDPRPPREQYHPAWSSELLANLEVAAACAARAGTQMVFVTYPSSGPLYGIANDAMRLAAIRASVPLVDLARRFVTRCPRGRCDLLFPDQHPTASGHAWIADVLVDGLPMAAAPD